MTTNTETVRPQAYRVADLTIDLVHREIRRKGSVLPCGRLTFELLVLLARRAPGVVSRETLAEQLWSGRYVSPATVKRRVALLRETLSEKADHPQYVRAVRGQGYSLIPRARLLGPTRARRWMRFGVAAAVLILAFVFGAETGYQDGLRPAIPARQGTATIVVTSWPHDLSEDDYSFVMGMADGLMNVIHRTNFVDRLNRELPGDNVIRGNSLTLLARAANNDFEALYVTLALLKDARPDFRSSRENELDSWSRVLQDTRTPAFGTPESAPAPEDELDPLRFANYRTYIVPRGLFHDENFMLVANLRFNRAEMHTHSQRLQSDAALSVAMAIDKEFSSSPSESENR